MNPRSKWLSLQNRLFQNIKTHDHHTQKHSILVHAIDRSSLTNPKTLNALSGVSWALVANFLLNSICRCTWKKKQKRDTSNLSNLIFHKFLESRRQVQARQLVWHGFTRNHSPHNSIVKHRVFPWIYVSSGIFPLPSSQMAKRINFVLDSESGGCTELALIHYVKQCTASQNLPPEKFFHERSRSPGKYGRIWRNTNGRKRRWKLKWQGARNVHSCPHPRTVWKRLGSSCSLEMFDTLSGLT